MQPKLTAGAMAGGAAVSGWRPAGAVLIVATLLSLLPAAAGATEAAKAAAGAGAKPANNFCAAYGAGFVRVEGSTTCVKVGGYVQSDAASQGMSGSVRTGDALAPALRSK